MGRFASSRYGISVGVAILASIGVAGGMIRAEDAAMVAAASEPLVLAQAQPQPQTDDAKKPAKKKSTANTPQAPPAPRGSYEGPPRGSHEGEPHDSFATNDS